MAEDDFWRRKRKREEEEEREAQERAEAKANLGDSVRTVDPELLKKFDEIVRRAPILIDQLEHLYRQYATGVLTRPPIEERGRLDQMMSALMNFPKPTAADRFRFNGIWSSYTTHKSRWEKLLQDIETGKIKRVAGPKR